MGFWGLLGLGAFVGTVVLASIVIAVISYDSIVDWFRQQMGHSVSNSNQLAVTVLQNLENDNYTVMQGVFNTATSEFESQRLVEGKQMESGFLRAHNEDGIAVWNL